MKDLNHYALSCMKDAEILGLNFTKPITWNISSRMTKAYGKTVYNKKTGEYTITIAKFLLEDSVSDMSLKNTIMHELIHTCPKCMNHGLEWKTLANYVNFSSETIFGYRYNIKRTTSYEEKGLDPDFNTKYIIKCKNCGNKIKKSRKCKLVSHPEYYRCAICGGKLKVKEIK